MSNQVEDYFNSTLLSHWKQNTVELLDVAMNLQNGRETNLKAYRSKCPTLDRTKCTSQETNVPAYCPGIYTVIQPHLWTTPLSD